MFPYDIHIHVIHVSSSARAEIAQMVEDQYKNFLPEAISDAQSLSLKIESVKSLANDQLDKINTVLGFTPNNDSKEVCFRLFALSTNALSFVLFAVWLECSSVQIVHSQT